MFRSACTRKSAFLLPVCLVFMFGSVCGIQAADKRPVSKQDLGRTLDQLRPETQEAEQRLRELDSRLRTIDEELKSPKRERSIDQIRIELEAIAKERAEKNKRLNELMDRHDRTVLDAIKSRSLVITGAAGVCGVIEHLYPEFLGTLEPKQASSFPPQLFYEPEGSDAAFKKLINGKAEAAVLDRPLNEEEKAVLAKAFPDPQRQPQQIIFCRAAGKSVV